VRVLVSDRGGEELQKAAGSLLAGSGNERWHDRARGIGRQGLRFGCHQGLCIAIHAD